jgi:hypothetical protein
MWLHTPAHKFIDPRKETKEEYEERKIKSVETQRRFHLSVAQVQQILAEEDLGEWEAGQVFNLNINTLK